MNTVIITVGIILYLSGTIGAYFSLYMYGLKKYRQSDKLKVGKYFVFPLLSLSWPLFGMFLLGLSIMKVTDTQMESN